MRSDVTVPILCRSAVAWLGVAGAGVLMSSGPDTQEVRTATDELATVLAELEVTVGEGPVRTARELGSPVLVGDFDSPEHSHRWPLYAPLAVQAGVHAQFVLPLRVGVIDVGIFVFHRTAPAPLEPELFADALAYGELMLLLLLNEQAGSTGDGSDIGLSLRSTQVHQATGMVAAQLDVSLDDAFAALRARAFAQQRPLSEIAADVVVRRFRFTREGGPS
ncbi:GAF domain-containing protein [Amycolatopsis rhabdoformis]|uniref:GAF domain-containing protein n=1 Tax=Amycolatopsis rhabdoformis TaxID=1448059 RepID=A0ABZ1I0Y6_9PSEU|nr:GAF domain-containing protein [Amycolatopsis rhabdoformis]WSE27561.1 GAF domain-containing protein [Amycolatopsis rhabdoformis]